MQTQRLLRLNATASVGEILFSDLPAFLEEQV